MCSSEFTAHYPQACKGEERFAALRLLLTTSRQVKEEVGKTEFRSFHYPKASKGKIGKAELASHYPRQVKGEIGNSEFTSQFLKVSKSISGLCKVKS